MKLTPKSQRLPNSWSGMYTCLSVICPPVYLPVYCLSTCISIYTCLSLWLCMCLFTCPSVCLSVCFVLTCLSAVRLLTGLIYIPVFLSTCLSLCLHVSLSASLSDPLYLCRCRRPKGQQPSVVLMWDRLLMVAGVCNDTIQYPLNQFRLVTNQFRLEPQTGAC